LACKYIKKIKVGLHTENERGRERKKG